MQDNNMTYGKVPPQALDLEEAIIGACLLEKDTFDTVLEIIPHPDVFYKHEHQKVYKSLIALHKSGNAIDLMTITEQLRKSGDLDNIGGAYYLTRLTMSVLSSAHVVAHSLIVYEKYMQREMIRAGSMVIGEAYKPDVDPLELISKAQNEFETIGVIPGAKKCISVGRSANRVLEEIYEHRKQPGDITGITTGYPSMDKKMYGWQDSNLIILAARPSVGKTAFALNLAFNATRTPHKTVGVIFYSMEMINTRVSKRALAFTAQVGLSLLNRPKTLTEIDLNSLHQGVKELQKYNIFIDDTSSLTTLEMKNKSKKLMREHPEIDKWLIIVDYLQLMKSDVKGNSVEQITQISRDLKKIPMELHCPVIALSQLNRDKTSSDIPTLSDLRGSGSIEQDADDVLFLSNPSAELIKQNATYKGKILVTGAKFRDGQLFELALSYDKELQLFSEPKTEFKSASRQTQQQHYQTPNPVAYNEHQSQSETIDDIPF